MARLLYLRLWCSPDPIGSPHQARPRERGDPGQVTCDEFNSILGNSRAGHRVRWRWKICAFPHLTRPAPRSNPEPARLRMQGPFEPDPARPGDRIPIFPLRRIAVVFTPTLLNDIRLGRSYTKSGIPLVSANQRGRVYRIAGSANL